MRMPGGYVRTVQSEAVNGAIQSVREALAALRETCPECRTPQQAPPYGYACHHHRWLFARSRDLIDVDRDTIVRLRRAARAILAECPPSDVSAELSAAVDHLDQMAAATTFEDRQARADRK